MNRGGALLWGFVGTVVLTGLMSASQGLGLSRMSLPYMLGTLFTADRDKAKLVGFGVHLLNGWLFAFVYAAASMVLVTANQPNSSKTTSVLSCVAAPGASTAPSSATARPSGSRSVSMCVPFWGPWRVPWWADRRRSVRQVQVRIATRIVGETAMNIA
jgi:hypothetical protein